MDHQHHRVATHDRYLADNGVGTQPVRLGAARTPAGIARAAAGSVDRGISGPPPEPASTMPPPGGMEAPPDALQPLQYQAPARLSRPRMRRWSPERSRTVRRYRIAIMTLAVLAGWGATMTYSAWLRSVQLEQELGVVRQDLHKVLDVLGALGFERPEGALNFSIYKAGTAIAMSSPPIVDVLFRPSGTGGVIDGRVTLFNDAERGLLPVVTLTLFDSAGRPLGEGQLSGEAAGAPLQAGEMRTYHVQIALERNAEPAWFRVRMHPRPEAGRARPADTGPLG
jgi:hypothetical protein